MATSSNGVALYYPHTQFRNLTWLKWALLFWDGGIRRIVPADMTPKDSDDVKMAEDAGAVINTDCAGYRESASSEFEKHLELYESVASGAERTAISIDKMTQDLAEKLLELDLADQLGYSGLTFNLNKYSHHYDVSWLELPRPLAATYMTLLAETMSRSIQAPIITDRPEYAEIARTFLGKPNEAGVPTSNDHSQVLQQLFVDFVTPKSVESASMASILQIREKRLDEIRRFRQEVEDVVSSLSACEDPNQFKDQIRAVTGRMRAAVDEQKAALKEFHLNFDERLITICSPSILLATFNAPHVEQIIAGALTVGIAAKLAVNRYRLKMESQSRASSYQYLLSLQRLLPEA